SGSRFMAEAGLVEVWTHPFWQTAPPGGRAPARLYYRPVVSTTLWLEWRLGGRRPWLLHLSNVLAHAACVVAVLLAARRVVPAAFPWPELGALVFALHPVHVEPVAFVSGRTDVWCTLLLVLALLAGDGDPRAPLGALRGLTALA